MTTRTSASLKQAFKRFVELIKPIEDVQHVAARDHGEPAISTYITKLDHAVMFEVFHAEYKIREEFPDLPVDFHIWYLEGRSLGDLLRPIPPLVYSRTPLTKADELEGPR